MHDCELVDTTLVEEWLAPTCNGCLPLFCHSGTFWDRQRSPQLSATKVTEPSLLVALEGSRSSSHAKSTNHRREKRMKRVPKHNASILVATARMKAEDGMIPKTYECKSESFDSKTIGVWCKLMDTNMKYCGPSARRVEDCLNGKNHGGGIPTSYVMGFGMAAHDMRYRRNKEILCRGSTESRRLDVFQKGARGKYTRPQRVPSFNSEDDLLDFDDDVQDNEEEDDGPELSRSEGKKRAAPPDGPARKRSRGDRTY
ncbi:hypothetical protein C8J57DRAFT_1246242 [Mycena rebaudengoi]|nr:hypothetical protein C8J57DRAFT_1246242 [Mycena rebaudengoi]